MKAVDLIRNKGIQYAVEIVENAPEGVLAWNEGYEFTCGQAINISDEDREKYFVDIGELKRLVGSWELVKDYKDRECGKWFFIANYCQKNLLAPHQADVYDFVGAKFDEAIADMESMGI